MLKRMMCALVLMGIGLAHAFTPQTGTWIVTSELNGKPGRGIALDVQNGVVVMQMYAYESDGQPTFYLGVGPLNDAVEANFQLIRYTGGRYFGSGALVGKAQSSPGTVKLRFTNGIAGFATFPNEPEVAISRFNYGYSAVPASLKGLWVFTAIGATSSLNDVVTLSKPGSPSANGNGILATADGLFGCEHQVSGGYAGSVLCAKVNGSNQLIRGYLMVYSVNDGEGFLINSNNTYADAQVFARRLKTPTDVGTGLVFKDDDSAAPDLTALRQHISDLAASAPAQ